MELHKDSKITCDRTLNQCSIELIDSSIRMRTAPLNEKDLPCPMSCAVFSPFLGRRRVTLASRSPDATAAAPRTRAPAEKPRQVNSSASYLFIFSADEANLESHLRHGPHPPCVGTSTWVLLLWTHLPLTQAWRCAQGVPSAQGMCCVRHPFFSLPSVVVHHRRLHGGWQQASRVGWSLGHVFVCNCGMLTLD
jgi:hypothetical protein